MKFGILAVFFLLASSRADALEIQVQPHERSTTVSTARFELIQSQLTAKLTFRIDKVTGKTDQMVNDDDGSGMWRTIQRKKHANDQIKPNEINYQIFTSGITTRDTFLINVHTGATWQMLEATDGSGRFWVPVKE